MVSGNTTTAVSISSWRDAWHWFKAKLPDLFTKGKFNFITIHYLYIIGLTLFFSLIIWGIGGMAYIDAIFFAGGSCTQSGLNTIDINKLYLGQQICFYVAAMFTNPIVIHGSVVFVRLYWFEKRFADVVQEARAFRSARSRSRVASAGVDPDVERGINPAALGAGVIRALRSTGRRLSARPQVTTGVDEKTADSPTDPPKAGFQDPDPRRPSRVDSGLRIPAQMNNEEHIRFLERQRNPHDDTTLRIPSPREFDRGGRPQNIGTTITDEGGHAMEKQNTAESGRRRSSQRETAHPASIGAHLTFEEPIRRGRAKKPDLPRLRTRKSLTRGSQTAAESSQTPRTPRTFNLGTRSFTFGSMGRSGSFKSQMEPMPYLSYAATVTRNSFFVNLSEEQREELGGIEYRALKTLAVILLGYFFGFQLLGILCLTPWIYTSRYYGSIVTGDGQGRAWWGIFTAASSLNDLGFTLTPDSMNSFSTTTWPLLIMTYLIIIGNTGFPCMLRFLIWLISKFTPVRSPLWDELQFLLDHPRRCFTLLFPRSATWWLFAILVLFNGIDLIFFVILDLNDPVVSSLPGWFQFLDGLFQAASTRTAGFSVVNLSSLHPAIQVSYLIMMYVSAYPIAISMRRTNVYEEKSLGIYGGSQRGDDDDEEGENGKEPSYVGAHLRRQLGFDLWYVFLGLFIVAIVEGDRLANANDPAFTLFTVLFEIVSAYGTVGLSLGYPGIDASFSAELHTLSKLVILAMMIRGRHRGLPYALDRAVLLPSESLHQREVMDAERIVSRRPSLAMSTARFRPETGLSTGVDADDDVPPDRVVSRRATGDSLRHGTAMQHGLGKAMFKLASKGPDLYGFREEAAREQRGSDSWS